HHGYSVSPVVTGKPISIGGSVGRSDATGRGVMIAAREAARVRGMPCAGSRVAVQGFGNVGEAVARLMHAQGCRIVALSDIYGGIYAPEGLDPIAARQHARQTGRVEGFPGTEPVSNSEVLERPCDFLIPAAIEGQITGENAARVQAAVVVEGANGPTTPEADAILAGRGVLVVPDILANAGGVTVSYFEWVQDLQSWFWSEGEINAHLERIMVSTFNRVAALASERRVGLRTAALTTAGTLGARQAAPAGKLEIFSWWTAGGEAEALNAVFAIYHARYPAVQIVNATVAGGAGTNAKAVLKTRMLGGDPPDSFQVHAGHELIDTWVRNGSMEPLTGLFKAEGWTTAMPRGLLDILSYKGDIWSVPVNIHRANVLWYNKKIFADAHLAPPATLDEFFKDADALKAKGIVPFALGDKEGWEAGHA